MKKILILLLLSFVFATPCFAAMSANIIWEFNASASANMTNGGGFVAGATGTDFSQYASAADIEAAYPALGKFSGNDLYCLDGDAVAPNLTSSTHDFVATDVGNVIHITGGTGWTVGWYQIVSCASNAATVDRAVGTDGVKSDGAWVEGGALSLNSTLDDDFFDQLVAGQKVYFKSGSYTLGEAVSASKNGTTQIPIFMTGYTGTRDTACNGVDRPSINGGANPFTTGNYWRVRNFMFTGTADNLFSIASSATAENCKIMCTSSSTTRTALYLGLAAIAKNCEVISYAGYGIFNGGSYGLIFGNYCHHSSSGIRTRNSTALINNISANNVLNGILALSTDAYWVGNILYGSESQIGTGINMAANYSNHALNNIIYGFQTGISATAADTQTYVDYNNLYNNLTQTTNITELSHDLSSNPLFVNAAGTLIEDCEDVWDRGCDADEVTVSGDNTVYQVGTYSVKMAVQTAADAGDLIAYENITSTDMSGYNGFGVWMRTSDASFAAGDWQFVIDDTANCASPIGTFNIPAMAANTWYWFYFDGLDMSSYTAIVSVGLKQINDEGAINFYIDDLRACDNDFTFSSSSGGGIGTGFPQSMPGCKGDYQMNMGVDQDDNASGGTSNDVLGVLD